MKVSKSVQKFLLVALLAMVSLSLTGCTEDKYIDGINTSLGSYNTAATGINAEIKKINNDNALLADTNWQNSAKTALDAFDKAGKSFASLPEAPERFKPVDGLVKDLAFETNLFVNSYRTMIKDQDINQLDAANAHMDKINSLMDKINDAITTANK
jgi:hypothetical protein